MASHRKNSFNRCCRSLQLQSPLSPNRPGPDQLNQPPDLGRIPAVNHSQDRRAGSLHSRVVDVDVRYEAPFRE